MEQSCWLNRHSVIILIYFNYIYEARALNKIISLSKFRFPQLFLVIGQSKIRNLTLLISYDSIIKFSTNFLLTLLFNYKFSWTFILINYLFYNLLFETRFSNNRVLNMDSMLSFVSSLLFRLSRLITLNIFVDVFHLR